MGRDTGRTAKRQKNCFCSGKVLLPRGMMNFYLILVVKFTFENEWPTSWPNWITHTNGWGGHNDANGCPKLRRAGFYGMAI